MAPLSQEQLLRDFQRSVPDIIGHSDRVIVGIDRQHNIRWQLLAGHLSAEEHFLVARFTRRWAGLKDSLPEERIGSQRTLLAAALYHALSARRNQSAIFDDYAGRVDEALTVRQVTAYVFGGLVTAALLIIASLIGIAGALPAIAAALAMGAIPGMLGAFTSVLLKTNSIVPREQLPIWFANVQGASRVGLGALFGTIAFLGIRGGLLAGVVADNSTVTFLLALAAGFSERWAPDLLGDLSDRTKLTAVTEPGDDHTGGQRLRRAPSKSDRPPTLQELEAMLPQEPEGERIASPARGGTSGSDLTATLPARPEVGGGAPLSARLPDEASPPNDVLRLLPDRPDAGPDPEALLSTLHDDAAPQESSPS